MREARCHGPRRPTQPRAATTAYRHNQATLFSRCALLPLASVRGVQCFAHAGRPEAGSPSPPPGGESAGPNAGADATAATAAAGVPSSRSFATAAGGGRAAALQEALRVVLSEQVGSGVGLIWVNGLWCDTVQMPNFGQVYVVPESFFSAPKLILLQFPR